MKLRAVITEQVYYSPVKRRLGDYQQLTTCTVEAARYQYDH
jgi:hypothetical protein